MPIAQDEYQSLKANFLKLFANVPVPLRDEIIVLIDNRPLTWNSAYGEIVNDTQRAEAILEGLKKVGVL